MSRARSPSRYRSGSARASAISSRRLSSSAIWVSTAARRALRALISLERALAILGIAEGGAEDGSFGRGPGRRDGGAGLVGAGAAFPEAAFAGVAVASAARDALRAR